jgi:sugar lactone lactonase YvrE
VTSRNPLLASARMSSIEAARSLPGRRGASLLFLALAGLLLLAALALPGAAGAKAFPDVIPLPDGWQPEGIATGRGTDFYVGSLANGAIYAGDLRTGEGGVLVAGQESRVAVGLAFDRRSGYLFVAGGPTGMAYVYDTRTGAEVAAFELTTAETAFVNDVVVTRQAAYFTDSFQAQLYRLALGPGGSVDAWAAPETIPLGGDFVMVPGAFNANGIEATRNGRWLILVSSAAGALYRVAPDSGVAQEIDLGGASVASGDGILLRGRTLFVVQNFLNQIAAVRLSPDLLTGEVVEIISDERFRIPTTVAAFGSSLYAVNARFDVPPQPDTEYEVVRVNIP